MITKDDGRNGSEMKDERHLIDCRVPFFFNQTFIRDPSLCNQNG